MSELDEQALEGVHAWAQKRIDERERRLRRKPLFDAMSGSTELLMTKTMPDLMAGPMAQVRRSTLKLGQAEEDWPQRQAEMEARLEAQLARARRRTEALRAWLETLS